MTKAKLIEVFCQKIGLTKTEGTDIIEKLLGIIKDTLVAGHTINISGFGAFVVREKNARIGRNPQTGATIEITSRRVLTFKPSKVLKDRINHS